MASVCCTILRRGSGVASLPVDGGWAVSLGADGLSRREKTSEVCSDSESPESLSGRRFQEVTATRLLLTCIYTVFKYFHPFVYRMLASWFEPALNLAHKNQKCPSES